MSRLELRVLGPMGAEVDGRDVALGSPQQLAVLAALTMSSGSIVPSSTIVDRLWPDEPPRSAGKLVQKYVSGLRSVLGADAIESAGGGYGLAVDPGAVDVWRFERAITAASRATSVDARIDALLGAERDWRGDPYGGAGEADFVVHERHRLGRLRVEATLDRLALDIDRGELAPATAALERLAAERPEHERAVALLMRALYAADRQIDALGAYRRHERHLRGELGVDPSPDIAALEHRILVHDDELRSERPSRSTAGDDPLDRAPAGPPGVTPATPGGEPPRESPGESPREEIRPVVAVVVLDVAPAGGPDDLLVHARRLTGDIGTIADAYGGEVERAADGEVVVVFGVPARDDDVERAVALSDAVVATRPRARVAVAAGDALVAVTPGVELLAGRVVEQARSLARATPPGHVELAPEVADRLDGRTEHDAIPMVGRTTEAGVIRDVWRRVVGDRRLRVVEVIGDPGIGKSRLVREMVGHLDPRPVTVVEMGFRGFGDGGLFAALRDAIGQLAAEADDRDQWLATLDLTDDERASMSLHLAPIFETVTEDGSTATSEWSGALARLLEVAVREPMVMIVEDAHWADPTVTAGLDEVIAHLVDQPILVLVTRRPEPSTPGFVPGGIAERAVLHLDPLELDEVRQLASAAGGALSPDVLELAADRSGGSPLFLLQYLHMLRDRPDSGSGEPPPDTVRLVISARLDYLAEPLRAAIQAAALLSSGIRADGVAAISERDEAEVVAALNVLVRSGLLMRSRRSPSPSGREFEFHHAVVADVVYGRLTRPTRIDLHRRAATWLDSIDEPAIDDLQSAAWHRRQVVELAVAADGTAADSDVTAARLSSTRAGDRLLHVDAPMAISAFDDALALARDDVDRADLLLRLGQITTDAGEFARATAALSEAADLYDRLGELAGAGEALARQARAWWYLGRADRTDDLLRRAFERLDASPPSPGHAHALVIAASQTALRGHARDAMDLAARAWPVVREHGTAEDAVRLLHAQGHARFDLDDPDGIHDLEESLSRTLEHRFGRLASQSYNNLAELVWATDGPMPAIELATSGLDMARSYGFLGQAPWHHAQLCELRTDAGDWDAVMHPDAAPQDSTPVVDWLITSLRARIEFWRGDDAAVSRLDAVIAAARVTQERQVVVPMLSAAIDAHAHLGDARRATQFAEELLKFAGSHAYNRLREAGLATRGLLAIDRADLADSLLHDGCPAIARRNLMWRTARAALTEADGRWDEARLAYLGLETEWTAFPHPFEAAHAAIGAARCAVRLELRDEAAAASDRARSRFADLRANRGLADLSSLTG